MASNQQFIESSDINKLAGQLIDIAAIWDLFVGELGVSRGTQEQITRNNGNHPGLAQICLVDGLHHWVTSDPTPTIEKVIAALRSKMVNNKTLAVAISREWGIEVAEEPAPVEQTDSCTAASQLVVAKPKAKRCYSVDQAELKSEQLQDDFIALVSEMKDNLKSKWTDLRKFCDHFILKLPLSIKEENEDFFAGRKREIQDATTFDELFYCLDRHWNYLNHSLLQGFSKAFGTPEYKRKFKAFTKEVAEFEKMITIEVFQEIEPPPRVDPPSGFEEFVTKHNLSFTSTLEDIERIRHKFCEKYQLHKFAFYLVRVLKGSVIITWLVPHSVARRLEAELEQEVKSKPSVAGDKAVVALHPGLEWKEATCQGKKEYNLRCDGDVLLITSSGVKHPEAFSHLPPPLLTREEIAEYLTDQGVPPDCPLDDIEIIKTRFSLSKEYEIVGVEQSTSERPLTTSYVKGRIKELFRKTKKPEVRLYYHGPGRKGTGDWCFADGFITFQDIADLYMERFRGCLLQIDSDCCYSGSWLKSCLEFLDKQGVQPCAHSACNKGVLIGINAACKSNEVAQSLFLSTRTMQIDKNTKYIYSVISNPSDPQHYVWLYSASIRCNNKAIEQPCTLPPDLTWEKQLAKEEEEEKAHRLRCLYEAITAGENPLQAAANWL